MKKILIAAAALSAAGTAWAETGLPDITLTGTLAGGSLSSRNSALTWDTETYGDAFNNWEVSFNVELKQTPGASDPFLSTSRSGNASTGWTFAVTSDGKVQWKDGLTVKTTSASSWASVGGGSVKITLSYDGSLLTATKDGGEKLTFSADSAVLTSGQSSFWTNGGKETFSGISLKGQNVIPEPSAFGLLAGIGALALVASRRRRR